MAEKDPALVFTESFCEPLGKNVNGLLVDSLKSLFGHVYYIWRTFNPALGYDDAIKYYGNVWAALAHMSFDGAMQKFGLTEVKDLPTLGRIIEDCFSGVPALCKTKRSTDREVVIHVLWCANPGYGPADNTYCRHDYYRQEVYLTYVYIWALIEDAKKNGLAEEVLVDLPTGRCRDGAACACQLIMRTMKADPDRLEMGTQEPVEYVLEKQGRTVEEQVCGTFIGFFAVDFTAWIQLFQNVSAKAQTIYNDLWRTFPPMWAKDARLDLEIGRVKTAQELADVIAYCQARKYVPFDVQVDGNKAVLTAKADPFMAVADMLQAPVEYKQAVAAMDEDFIANVIKEVKMDGAATAVCTKHLGRGDDSTVIEITVK